MQCRLCFQSLLRLEQLSPFPCSGPDQYISLLSSRDSLALGPSGSDQFVFLLSSWDFLAPGLSAFSRLLFGLEVSAKTTGLTLLFFGPSASPPEPFKFFPPYSPSTTPQMFLMFFSPTWILLQMLLSACSAELVTGPCYWEAVLHWHLKRVHRSSSEHFGFFFIDMFPRLPDHVQLWVTEDVFLKGRVTCYWQAWDVFVASL